MLARNREGGRGGAECRQSGETGEGGEEPVVAKAWRRRWRRRGRRWRASGGGGAVVGSGGGSDGASKTEIAIKYITGEK